MSEFIRYAVEDGIGTVTIDRPEKRNAMTFAMLGSFIETLHRAGTDADARVVIITGVPGAVPHANAFTPDVWREHRAWYRPQTRRAVEQYYARDFEVFGYQF